MKNDTEIYKGIKIVKTDDIQKPFSVIQLNVPIIGVLETGHKDIDSAKKYIDKIKK